MFTVQTCSLKLLSKLFVIRDLNGAPSYKLNYDNHQLIHVTDWLPTIVEGIAGLGTSGN